MEADAYREAIARRLPEARGMGVPILWTLFARVASTARAEALVERVGPSVLAGLRVRDLAAVELELDAGFRPARWARLERGEGWTEPARVEGPVFGPPEGFGALVRAVAERDGAAAWAMMRRGSPVERARLTPEQLAPYLKTLEVAVREEALAVLADVAG